MRDLISSVAVILFVTINGSFQFVNFILSSVELVFENDDLLFGVCYCSILVVDIVQVSLNLEKNVYK